MRDAPAVVTSPTILSCDMSAVAPKPGRLFGYSLPFLKSTQCRRWEICGRVDLLAAGRIEPFHVHLPPEALEMKWILADDAVGALLQRVFRPGLVSMVTIMSL